MTGPVSGLSAATSVLPGEAASDSSLRWAGRGCSWCHVGGTSLSGVWRSTTLRSISGATWETWNLLQNSGCFPIPMNVHPSTNGSFRPKADISGGAYSADVFYTLATKCGRANALLLGLLGVTRASSTLGPGVPLSTLIGRWAQLRIDGRAGNGAPGERLLIRANYRRDQIDVFVDWCADCIACGIASRRVLSVLFQLIAGILVELPVSARS